MVYEFYIKNASVEQMRQFVGFAESLKSTTYTYLEYRNRITTTLKSSLVKVMCSRDDYHELFYWLKDKQIHGKVLVSNGEVNI